MDFQSLVNRSIIAWQTINFHGPEPDTWIYIYTLRLRGYHSLEEVLQRRSFWFFQLRDSFMRQTVFLKWDPTRLDEYILVPIGVGFANKRDCFFVSHYWRTREHPDPQAVDLVQFQQDLKDMEWSYIWIDWTCMPQVPRSEIQREYFNRMLQNIPMLIRDCATTWRFPAFEPRAWILYEVAELVIHHKNFIWTDDNRCFINHVLEMMADGVQPVFKKYGYRCSSGSDTNLVTGWLELMILMAKILPNVHDRRQCFDAINEPHTSICTCYVTGPIQTIDKVKGVISHEGATYKIGPISHRDAASPMSRRTFDSDDTASPLVITIDKVNGVISHQGATYEFTPIYHAASFALPKGSDDQPGATKQIESNETFAGEKSSVSSPGSGTSEQASAKSEQQNSPTESKHSKKSKLGAGWIRRLIDSMPGK